MPCHCHNIKATFMDVNNSVCVTCLDLQLLANHYEHSWRYYCLTGGCGGRGCASAEELHLSRQLFWSTLRALARKVGRDEAHLFTRLSVMLHTHNALLWDSKRQAGFLVNTRWPFFSIVLAVMLLFLLNLSCMKLNFQD